MARGGRGVTLWLARVKGRDKEGQRVERRGKEGDKQRNKKKRVQGQSLR